MQPLRPTTKTDATLVALRTRLLDLHSNLITLRDHSAMLRDNVGPSRNATFPLFLSIHSTLAKLSEQLTTDLDRSQQEGLPYYAAVPNLPDPVTPELLRTRLDMDVEREFQTMAHAFKGDASQKVMRYNQAVEAVLKAIAEKRDKLEQPRPAQPAPNAPAPAAEMILAAIANGSNLTS
ncbi:unnamed protein product [Agarophyton chilense]|eukprot:gb/GEZJ01005220.1/.p1 GENE.gb/GEZJ01005220.1/~~gb/GEZJ01005220.1/.p1  ORF type:complete len:178 (+),score=28.92 gb/GEZJ01005220.1/:139-672(+)